MVQCISALCVVGMIILALLTIVRAVTIEEAMKALAKAFVAVVLALWALCALRAFVPVAVSALKEFTAWLVVSALALIGIAVIAGISWKFFVRLGERTNTEEKHE